jgi:hypothetical protein
MVHNSSAAVPQPDPNDRLDAASKNRTSAWKKVAGTFGDAAEIARKAAALGQSGAERSAELGKRALTAASDTARGVTSAATSAGSSLGSAASYLDAQLDEHGVKQAIGVTAGAAIGKLDEVTGKRLVELLEEKLRIQDLYNDVLATRLAEALERISKLEARLDDN